MDPQVYRRIFEKGCVMGIMRSSGRKGMGQAYLCYCRTRLAKYTGMGAKISLEGKVN